MVLKAYDLLGFLAGSVDYDDPISMRQDQMLLGWFMLAVYPTILPQITRYTTSKRVWEALAQMFASTSKLRLLQLCHQLHTVRKGILLVTNYLSKITAIYDELHAAGESVNEHELVLLVLSGLDSDYEAFTTVLATKEADLTFIEFQGLLLTQELRNNSVLAQTTSSTLNPSVNYVKSTSGSKNTLICQICNKRGHTALICYNHHNEAICPPPPADNNKNQFGKRPNRKLDLSLNLSRVIMGENI